MKINIIHVVLLELLVWLEHYVFAFRELGAKRYPRVMKWYSLSVVDT